MKTLVTAHSGADHTEENSVGFLWHAFATAADAVEVDVRMLAGELVLGHDAVGVTHFAVSLRQAFTMLQEDRSGKRMNCDLKEAGLEKPVYELALETEVVDRILYTGCVSVERMRAEGLLQKVEVWLNIEEAVPALRTMWEAAQGAARGGATSSALRAPSPQGEGSESAVTWNAGDRCEELRGRSECPSVTSYVRQTCEICVDAGIQVLNVPKEIVDDTFCEILKEYGLQASVWTVNDAEEARRLMQLPQVMNITTRNVAEMTKGTVLNVTLGSR